MPRPDHSELLSLHKKASEQRRQYEGDWRLNLAYLSGDQHVEYIPSSATVVGIDKIEGIERVTRNHILKINRIERAKILKNAPTPIALPVSDSMDDIITARISTAYFRQLTEQWSFKHRLRSAVSWTLATGNGFFKWWWDGKAKTPRCTVTPPFELFFDPYATNANDARYVFHTQFMPEEVVLALWGTGKKKFINATTRNSAYATETSQAWALPGDDQRAALEGVVVHEYWQPPSPTDQRGAYVVFTADGILHEGDFPYEHKRLPFTQIGHIERTGSLWYRSGIDALRPLQDELNRTEAQIVENRNMSAGKWWIDDLLNMQEMPSAEPRQILRGSGPAGMKPEFIQVNSLPPWVGNEPDRLANAMSDLIGQHEVSNAGVPGRVEAASAIQLLQEVDDSVLQDVRESLETAVADGFMMAISYLKQYGDPVTTVKVYDKSGALEMMELKRDKLDINMRVVSRTTSGLPMSLAGRQQTVIDMKRYGIIEDNNKILEMMDLPAEQFDLLSDQDDRNKAHRENKLVAAGQHAKVRANDFDNHATHRMQHWKFMKTPEFEALEQELKDYLRFHVAEHDNWEKILLGREAEKNLIAQGQMQAPAAPGVQPMEPAPPGGVSEQLSQQQDFGSPPPAEMPGQEAPQPMPQETNQPAPALA